jgi:hypothetical protein
MAKKPEEEPLVGDSTEADHRKKRLLTISFVAMVFIGLGNKIFQKLQTLPMHRYPVFLSQLTTFIYIPVSFAYILPMMRWGSAITPEQRRIPWYKFAIMGCLDSIAGIMQIFAVNFLPGALVILLSQSAIPISMVISRFLLKTAYGRHNYAGAVLVMCGIVIVLSPSFTAHGSDQQDSSTKELIWAATFILSCVPMTLSSVYKEKALGDVDIDVVYLNGWVAFWQFLIGIPLAIPSAYAIGLSLSELPANFANGARCYVGLNSLPGDNCFLEGPLFVNSYMSFNILYNVLIIMILKYGSANLLWLAMTIMVPLGNATFALPFVPGNSPMHATDIIGLIIIMTGLIIYRFWDSIRSMYLKIRGKEPTVAPLVRPEAPADEPEFPQKRARSLHLNPPNVDVTLLGIEDQMATKHPTEGDSTTHQRYVDRVLQAQSSGQQLSTPLISPQDFPSRSSSIPQA